MTAERSEIGIQGLDRLARAAALGLTAALVATMIFTFLSLAMAWRAADDASAAATRSRLWASARYALSSQESLERKYRLEPSAEVKSAVVDAGAALTRTVGRIAAIGNDDDRIITRKVLRDHAAYTRAMGDLFGAMDRHRSDIAAKIDGARVDPIFATIRQDIDEPAEREHLIAATKTHGLRSLRLRNEWINAALASVATIFLIATLRIVRAYRRRLLETHAAKVLSLENAALIDHLTQLGNHRAYNEDLQHELSAAMRDRTELTLALVDVDELKLLNDRRGHLHGDEVLASLGSVLKTLDKEVKAYRIGGDEFALILPHTPQAFACKTLERARREAVIVMQGATISVGIATLCDAALDPDTLHARADASLYAAKHSGRDSITVYDSTDERLSLVSPARFAGWNALIADRNLAIAFQPIWDVERHEVLAYEALARPDAIYGFSEPQQAFAFAERIGRAYELDEVCLKAALERARTMPPDTLLFLNVSPQSLNDHRFDAVAFTAAVRGSGHVPERVIVEITERAIVRVAGIIEVASRLREAGFRIALDDTGAGNAGLELLSRLPLDFIKIDRQVVLKAVTDRSARGVVAGIVAIAKVTGTYVIAEGIETLEMLELASKPSSDPRRKRNIHGLQGYLLGSPSDTFVTASERVATSDLIARAGKAVERLSGIQRSTP